MALSDDDAKRLADLERMLRSRKQRPIAYRESIPMIEAEIAALRAKA